MIATPAVFADNTDHLPAEHREHHHPARRAPDTTKFDPVPVCPGRGLFRLGSRSSRHRGGLAGHSIRLIVICRHTPKQHRATCSGLACMSTDSPELLAAAKSRRVRLLRDRTGEDGPRLGRWETTGHQDEFFLGGFVDSCHAGPYPSPSASPATALAYCTRCCASAPPRRPVVAGAPGPYGCRRTPC